jgi:hypothetical protein
MLEGMKSTPLQTEYTPSDLILFLPCGPPHSSFQLRQNKRAHGIFDLDKGGFVNPSTNMSLYLESFQNS